MLIHMGSSQADVSPGESTRCLFHCTQLRASQTLHSYLTQPTWLPSKQLLPLLPCAFFPTQTNNRISSWINNRAPCLPVFPQLAVQQSVFPCRPRHTHSVQMCSWHHGRQLYCNFQAECVSPPSSPPTLLLRGANDLIKLSNSYLYHVVN